MRRATVAVAVCLLACFVSISVCVGAGPEPQQPGQQAAVQAQQRGGGNSVVAWVALGFSGAAALIAWHQARSARRSADSAEAQVRIAEAQAAVAWGTVVPHVVLGTDDCDESILNEGAGAAFNVRIFVCEEDPDTVREVVSLLPGKTAKPLPRKLYALDDAMEKGQHVKVTWRDSLEREGITVRRYTQGAGWNHCSPPASCPWCAQETLIVGPKGIGATVKDVQELARVP